MKMYLVLFLNNMDLNSKIKKSKQILIKSFKKFKNDEIAVAWTGHKDSTVLLHIVKSILVSNPVLAFTNITGDEFPEALKFIKKISKKWGIKVIIINNLDKIAAIEEGVKKYRIKAYISAIRRDENIARKKETYFSKRKTHLRVHPLLDFTESDIWDYIKQNKIPYLKLYDQGFRSLGEAENTKPAKKQERSGRLKAKELQMERLRSLGYW